MNRVTVLDSGYYRESGVRCSSANKLKINKLAVKNAIASDTHLSISQKLKFIKSYETLIKNDKESMSTLQNWVSQAYLKHHQVEGIIKHLRHRNDQINEHALNVSKSIAKKRMEYIRRPMKVRSHQSSDSKPHLIPIMENLRNLLTPQMISLKHNPSKNMRGINDFVQKKRLSQSINFSTIKGKLF